MIALNISSDSHLSAESGLRPVNLRTDLAPLADLIELVFASSMDENGRLAIQEMRTMSRLGSALGFLGRINELVLGISLGYVWIEDGRLVGNVSVYPANYPYGGGAGWIIANVGVHPDYQRRGIAYQLMRAALRMIAGKGGEHAILQVDYDNTPAINLYARLGFIMERAFTTWTRSSMMPAPPENNTLFITRRTSGEWSQEYELAQQARPTNRGGIGWLRPLHPALFRIPLWRQMWETLTFSGIERLVVRSPDARRLLASGWVENPFASSRTRLTLLANPVEPPVYIEAILGNILRRQRTSSFSIEHPRDDETVNELLRRHRFLAERAVWHMRYDF